MHAGGILEGVSSDLLEEVVEIGGLRLSVERPRRPEDLIDEEAFDEDEFLPYWAELWPSAVALADVAARAPLAGLRVLELGCGLGLPSLAAAARGADVLATDWSADAVRGAAANAQRNGLAVRTAVWRWSDDAGGLGDPFDLVLASDVLYERRNGAWVLDALGRVLARDGEAWIADPGRGTADAFFTAAPGVYAVEPMPHAGPPGVRVSRLRPLRGTR